MVGVVQLKIENETPEEEIIIPARCVLLQPKGHTAWVIENDSAVRKEIIIGGYEADGVRIETGLQAGDTLIIDGYQKLYNGCKVIVD